MKYNTLLVYPVLIINDFYVSCELYITLALSYVIESTLSFGKIDVKQCLVVYLHTVRFISVRRSDENLVVLVQCYNCRHRNTIVYAYPEV